MLDTNMAIIKKCVKKRKYSQIINILKELVEAIIITKNILNLEINIVVSKLLASALAADK